MGGRRDEGMSSYKEEGGGWFVSGGEGVGKGGVWV
jgi:hypothetical protein